METFCLTEFIRVDVCTFPLLLRRFLLDIVFTEHICLNVAVLLL